MIEYRKGSLFDAPKGSILAHACNTQGVWGSGIAAQFKVRFPKTYRKYHSDCAIGQPTGKTLLFNSEKGYDVACLLTSEGYGKNADSEKKILDATRRAMDWLLCIVTAAEPWQEIHMPKINSGLFGVPWEKTEAVLKEILAPYEGTDLKIVVWEL